ncbi:MAG: SpoIIE family protein phosphatase [Bacteroidales bacterium]|nr:SpoIIE family protein phosphatase [Bacteroidales bacterium]
MPRTENILLSLLILLLTSITPAMSQDTSGQVYEASMRRLSSIKEDSTRLNAFRAAIDTCSTKETAERLSDAFVELSIKNGSAGNLVVAYMYSGYFANNNGNVVKAIDQTFKGLEIADSLDLTSIKTTLLTNISAYLGSINDHEGSFQYIQKAQEVAEKADDYENLVEIYYNVAISYIDQELYESAIQYFRKDIEAAMKTGISNTTEQELTIQSLRIKNAMKLHDTAAVLGQTDYVNTLMGEIHRIEDPSGISNFCIAMITNNIDAAALAPHRRDEYLEKCGQYFQILRNTIEESDAKFLYKVAFNPHYARYLAVCGKTDQAWNLLKDTTNFLDNDGYDMAMYEYYKAKKDYKNAYKYFWKINRNNYKKHSLETAIHYEKSESRSTYEQRIAELQTKAQDRDKDFEETKHFNMIVRACSAGLLMIGLAIMVVCLYNIRQRNKANRQLKQSTEELLMANEELNMQREEILSQTNEIQQQSGIITSQRDVLSAYNYQLLDSINIARDIQRAVMVSSEKLREAVGDNFIYWKPRDIVSGDFYWCAKIGHLSFLAVADCTGHGVPGALLSMYEISMLNDIVLRNSHSNAAEILMTLKNTFVKSFVFDEEQYFLDGMDVAFLILNHDSMTLDYAGAKRPLIIVRNGVLHEYKPDKISISYNPTRKDEPFTDHQIQIQKGDMVYAFSDGISDQFGYEDGVTKFGSRQLQNILSEMSFFDLPAQRRIIESSVDNWRIGAFFAGLTEIKAPQLDDQLLIGVRI